MPPDPVAGGGRGSDACGKIRRAGSAMSREKRASPRKHGDARKLETTTRIWEIERREGAWSRSVVPIVPAVMVVAVPVVIITVAEAPPIAVPAVEPAAPLVHLDPAESGPAEPTVVVAVAVVIDYYRAVLIPPPPVGAAPGPAPRFHDDHPRGVPIDHHDPPYRLPIGHHRGGLADDHVPPDRPAMDHHACLDHLGGRRAGCEQEPERHAADHDAGFHGNLGHEFDNRAPVRGCDRRAMR